MVWASRAAGRWKATSWNCSARVGVLVPSPSVNRPPERSSRVAAIMASVAGLRPQIDEMPVAIRMRVVLMAISARMTPASNPQPSGTRTVS